MIKNIKIKVETDEQNQYFLNKLLDVNKRFAWFVGMYLGSDDYDYTSYGYYISDCSVWKGFRYFVIDADSDLMLCVFEEYYNTRKEKEITFEEFKELEDTTSCIEKE